MFHTQIKRFSVESNSLNCNHKNAYLTVLESSNTKINVPNVPQHNVLNNMSTHCSLLNTDSPRGTEMENSNHEAINKPVKGVEMHILKQLEAIQKSVDSIMNCKYKNTTLENTLFIIKNKLIHTKPIFMATVTSMGKQNRQKSIQHNYNNDDILQGKTHTSLSALKMNDKHLLQPNRHEFKGQTNSSGKHVNNVLLI